MRFSALTRRQIFEAGGALGVLTLGGGLISVIGRAADMAKVDMQLGWLAGNGQLGEVVAKREGFYAEEGLDFSITPGGPNVDGVASVAAGRSQAGNLSSSPSLMLARSAGIPVKAIAAGYQKHPFTYFSLASNPIREPRDMIGKTIATQPTAFILARALLAKHGISEDQVELVNMGSDMSQLMTGQADAVTGWLTNINALKVIGEDRVDMMLWDTGIQLYANVYYTTDQMLAEHEDVLVGYLRATARGWGWTKENPEGAVDHLVAEYPNLERASELEAVGPVLGFSFNETTKAHGWGHMEPANWQAQIDTYAELDQFTGAVPKLDEVVTPAVLEATREIRLAVG
jgi:NitT/TauT family transport system substrate-binding protein